MDNKDIQRLTGQALIEKIFANTLIMIAYIDPGFFILKVNTAFAKAAGREAEFFPGKNFFHLFPDNDRRLLFQEVIQSRESTTVYGCSFYFPNNPAFENRYVDLSLQPTISPAGHVDGLILVLTDVTKRKELEQELRETQRQLYVSQHLAGIGKLATIVAHEFRNPLGVIQAALYNIGEETSNPRILEHITMIEKKIDESTEIINNLLSYSRIKDTSFELTPVIPLLKDTIVSFENRIRRKNLVCMTNDMGMAKNPCIPLDPYQIKEVIVNILNNGYESLKDKKGIISIHTFFDAQNFLVISIRDNGSGIDKENLGSIFEPFFTTKHTGTGLGLSICKEIITLHKGTISIHSKKGHGTEVILRLPSSQAD